MRVWLSLVLVLTACKSPSKTESGAEGGRNWSAQMQSLSQDVKKLLPFLYNRDAYRDPKNRPEIQGYLKELSGIADHIKPEAGKRFIGDDLLLEYSLGNLQDDLNRASFAFANGQIEYSRAAAKASFTRCFQCHSVTQAGGSAAWDLDQLHNLNLAPLEKADLLVATRKYDKALSYMEGLLSSPEFQQNYAFDFESLLRRYLALIIRVEKTPQRATRELDKILERGDAPRFLQEQADGWRQSLKSWAAEKKQPVRNSKELFAQVEKRFTKAAGIQHFEKDHAGDVEYLRATAALHDGMNWLKTPEEQQQGMYWLGRAYEVLDELGSWNLHETYYEACVAKLPKSPMAQRCYSRLEASLYMGYSGSSGTHLPAEEKARLAKLKDKMK